MRILVFLLFCLFCTTCTPPPEGGEADDPALRDKITRIENGLQPRLQIIGFDVPKYNVEERLQELGIPGLSVAVLRNGEVEWARGYGMADSTDNRPVTPETLFQAGSISKPVAATSAMQLFERGVLDLDANVNDYLSSWRVPDNEFTTREKVTTRRLLTHTAGLTVHGFPGYPRGGGPAQRSRHPGRQG